MLLVTEICIPLSKLACQISDFSVYDDNHGFAVPNE